MGTYTGLAINAKIRCPLRHTKIAQSILVFIGMLCVSTNAAYSQVVEKTDDNRIIAQLKVDGSSGLYQNIYSGNSFVSAVELDIEWWTLFGEIVYSNKIRWERSDVFKFGEGGDYPMTRDRLEKYPDLLKRFDALKPSDIKMTLNFRAFRGDGSGRENPSPSLFDLQSGAQQFEVKLQTTPHFQIVKSGEKGFVLSPGRPQGWKSFLKPLFATGSNTNELIKNTWQASDGIIFAESEPLKVTQVTPPTAALNNIAEEYWRREKKEEESEKCEDDFWGECEDEEEKEEDDADTEDKCEEDFWGDCEKEEEAGDKTDDEDEFWGDEDSGNDNFEIKRNDQGQMGVVGARGQTLIPFRNWTIERFADGVAKVVNVPKTVPPTCEGSWYIYVDQQEIGLVDKSGNWILEPDRTARAYVTKPQNYSPITLRRTYECQESPSVCAARKREREARARRAREKKRRADEISRRQRSACESKLPSFKSTLRRRGFSVD